MIQEHVLIYYFAVAKHLLNLIQALDYFFSHEFILVIVVLLRNNLCVEPSIYLFLRVTFTNPEYCSAAILNSFNLCG